MSQETNIKLWMERLATIAKNLKNKQWDLTSLTTTEQSNLVWAINEIVAAAIAINDSTASVSEVYSSSKVDQLIATAVSDVLWGAWVDDDTLWELAAQITALAQADNWLVSATNSQTFTAWEKSQARQNIWAVDQAVYDALVTALWSLTRDYVADIDAIYNA